MTYDSESGRQRNVLLSATNRKFDRIEELASSRWTKTGQTDHWSRLGRSDENRLRWGRGGIVRGQKCGRSDRLEFYPIGNLNVWLKGLRLFVDHVDHLLHANDGSLTFLPWVAPWGLKRTKFFFSESFFRLKIKVMERLFMRKLLSEDTLDKSSPGYAWKNSSANTLRKILVTT